jgi:uncharacterized protein (TIGR02271 family)
MYNRSQFRRGLDVFDRDGQKVGDVSDVGPNYLRVPTGFLGLGQDLYVPFSAVDRVTDQAVYLNVSKNNFPMHDWAAAPSEAARTGTSAAAATGAAMAGSMAGAPHVYGSTISAQEAVGHNLCDVNRKQIGNISSAGPTYFHVITGMLGLGQDLFVPIDAVDHCSKDCCYLGIAAEEIQGRGWTTRPAEVTTTPRAMETGARPSDLGLEAGRGVYRIPLREEEIEISRHREKVGEVVISKDVVEEQRTIDVPVRREEVRIERHAVTGEASRAEGPLTPESASETIRVPIYEECVDVEKRQFVSEEIVVSPESSTHQERITRTVRREVPHVQTTGEADQFVEGDELIEGKTASELKAEEIDREKQQRRA